MPAYATPSILIDLTATIQAASAPAINAILDTAAGGALSVDRTGIIRNANPETSRFFNIDCHDLNNRRIETLLPGFDASFLDLIWRALEANHRVRVTANAVRQDQGILPVYVDLQLGNNPDDTPSRLMALVIYERPAPPEHESREGIEVLTQDQRLASAGAIAGQIAHDYNNLLTPLIAYPQLIKRDIPPNGPASEFLTLMEKTANEMAAINQQLLVFARRGLPPAQTEFDLRDVLRQIVSIAVRPKEIAVEQKLDNAPLIVMGSSERLITAFKHLVQNAVESISGGGSIIVKANVLYLDQPVTTKFAGKPGEYIHVAITDTGSGIADAIRDRIYEPFFSTKRGPTRRGAGLGLSIVFGIVRDHGGFLDFESEIGRGTTFNVYLPHHRSSSEPAPTPPARNTRPESILVIDDDTMQAGIIVNHLASLGFTVSSVSSGEDALCRLERLRYDLIILDMIFEGGIDGLETFMAIRKSNPNQRVILISGYSQSAQRIALAQQLGAGHFLKKPFTLEKLADLVMREFAPAPRETEEVNPDRMRVLVVDDNKMIRSLFSIIISAEFPHATIDQATDGDEAVRLFSASPYQIVIMDLQMPRMNGMDSFEALSAVCREKQWRDPPVIFCTGFMPPEKLNDILNRGPRYKLLRKPVRAEDLIKAIRESL